MTMVSVTLVLALKDGLLLKTMDVLVKMKTNAPTVNILVTSPMVSVLILTVHLTVHVMTDTIWEMMVFVLMTTNAMEKGMEMIAMLTMVIATILSDHTLVLVTLVMKS